MSDTPYSPPPSPMPPVPEYQATKVSGLATAAMVLGIVSIPAGCVMIGPLLGLVAVVLGIVGLVRIGRDPMRVAGKGQAITGLVTGLFGIILMPAIMLPILGRSRELANRSACQANITGVLKASAVYGEENGQVLPTAGNPMAGTYTTAPFGDTGTADRARALEKMSGDRTGNVLACQWMLVVQGMVSPKSFRCKSDPHGSSSAAPTQSPSGSYYGSEQTANQISFSIAYPWMPSGGPWIGGWWRKTDDSSIPLMADMAPLQGTGSPARSLYADNTKNRVLNSGNHGGDGQNVGFGDAHAEWTRKPNVGQSGENIYSSGYDGKLGTEWGRSQSARDISATGNPYDILMVPQRDLNTGALH